MKKITTAERRKIVEERLPLLYKLMESCSLCPRKCGVNRLKGEKGFCRTTDKIKIASWAQHRGEEPPISGTNGSGAIFPSCCTFACKFCQNFPFSQLDNGVFMTPQELAKKYDLPFNTYSADELNSLEGDFTKSDFVKSVVEVDNVCERSAIMESNGKLIRRKDTCDGAGVTVALAINDPNISWEK